MPSPLSVTVRSLLVSLPFTVEPEFVYVLVSVIVNVSTTFALPPTGGTIAPELCGEPTATDETGVASQLVPLIVPASVSVVLPSVNANEKGIAPEEKQLSPAAAVYVKS